MVNIVDVRKYRGFIFDLDGVLWRGDETVAGAPQTVNRLRELGGRLAFVTNNASKHRTKCLDKLKSAGVKATLEEVISSGSATAQYLKEKHGEGRVHVMGTDDLKREMVEAGHEVVETEADYVVVGFDKGFNYEKLDKAYRTLAEHNGLFVACNGNRLFVEEDGRHPGVLPSVEALACASGRRPDVFVGKPNAPIMEMTLELLGLSPGECLIVGDTLDMDIQWGLNCGVDTLFVLSGMDSLNTVKATGIKPTYVLSSVSEIPLP
ncbi:Phosphoglycolate phosphatase [uncultured archaeon]|nr:Phosphoglycolate phosphatase [uncultured archaeon]